MKKLLAAILVILSIGAGTITAMADPTQPPAITTTLNLN